MGPEGMSLTASMGLGHLHPHYHPPAAKFHPQWSQGSRTRFSGYFKIH